VWSGWQLTGGGGGGGAVGGFDRSVGELEAVLAARVADADAAVRSAARHCLLDLEACRPASASKVWRMSSFLRLTESCCAERERVRVRVSGFEGARERKRASVQKESGRGRGCK
jgi:hypothetical protein